MPVSRRRWCGVSLSIPGLVAFLLALAISPSQLIGQELADPVPGNGVGGMRVERPISEPPNDWREALPPIPSAMTVSGAQKVMVLRVRFNDYPTDTRYSKSEVEDLFVLLDQLWMDTSYGVMSIDSQVTDLFALPDDRSDYIDDHATGDTSDGDKFGKVLLDAIDNSPGGLDWTNLAAIMVVMGEPGTVMGNQFHRGQATVCNLPQGPGGDIETVGCAIFSENPSENDNQVWGRWAHEIGHAFQQGGPAHPSNYNSEFELLDSNYPGQTGVFEKQDDVAYPGWLPVSKYIEFNPPGSGLPGEGGGTANLYAMEYDPASKPNNQAARAHITDDLYYLVSVRRRVLGDDTNGDFSPFGIPDEGVLIERVSEGADPWVVLQGPGGVRNDLWQEMETYQNLSDGIQIAVVQKIDDDNYGVRITYAQDGGWMQPDVAMEPWTSPPGNTWETTDIWIDSPINGYDSYRYGFWNDLSGNSVPRLNGDPPTIGLTNRLSARVRNVGQLTATNVKVTFQITDPPGVGIAGAEGWVTLGSVDSGDFPGLANILTGAFVDVFTEWIPDFEIPDGAELEDGFFDFHTCLRVIIDPVAGEVVLGNQDGDEEQENIFQVQVDEGDAGEMLTESFRIYNDSLVEGRYFHLSYESDLPSDWVLDLNGGDFGLDLAPGEVREIPVSVTPSGMPPLGSLFRVDVRARKRRDLVNDLDANDVHHEFKDVGGFSFQFPAVRRPTLQCEVTQDPDGWFVTGKLEALDFDQFYDPQLPPRVMVLPGDTNNRFAEPSIVAVINRDGTFTGFLPPTDEPIYCLFGGTDMLASTGARASGPLIFADGFESGDLSAW